MYVVYTTLLFFQGITNCFLIVIKMFKEHMLCARCFEALYLYFVENVFFHVQIVIATT